MTITVDIESLDQEGRGVAHADGKVVFVSGALPGERVAIEFGKRRPSYDTARVVSIERASASRVTPRCPHFGVCGGCTLQHADTALQIAAKQRALEDAFARIGRVRPETLLPPIDGAAWAYRYRARLSVRHVVKKGGVLVGFHERQSSFVADMRECHVVPRKLSDLLLPLRALIESLSIRDRLPQIEVAIGEMGSETTYSKVGSETTYSGATHSRPPGGEAPREREIVSDPNSYALVMRVLETPTPSDEEKLVAFADAHGVAIWLQTGGPGTVAPFHPKNSTLAYALPEFDVALPFAPTDFTQVNFGVNRVLVRRALALLAPQPSERVADFFCGIGNFTLPIARSGATVVGVEGNAALVRRAQENAAHNGLAARASFVVANLFTATAESVAALGAVDRALIDPPREGAIELAKALPHRDDERALARLVYVSCNPATLARDAAVLVNERGYRLAAAGIVNMFPHTAHVESMAVFER
ncbi:MAG: 23S rRNA (uracil(1939)-C(5))-methyltransferase RlmD [Casimicrobiaceae bacterium]